jgi:glutaredoxin
MKLTLVTRSNCGLCDEAASMLRGMGIQFEAVDVDSDEQLLALYDEFVPVILAGGHELVRAPIDREVLRSALATAKLDSGE